VENSRECSQEHCKEINRKYVPTHFYISGKSVPDRQFFQTEGFCEVNQVFNVKLVESET
jgi:hypothetical protein